ncbi:MAG TPA: PspC domain-containing protein [Acidimicrobiia bacterium]
MDIETETTTESPPGSEEQVKVRTTELTRSSEQKMIAGVAEGLARRTGIWTGWIRIAFVLLAFAGGFGVAAYLVLWFLVRADNEPNTLAERFFSRTTSAGAWIGVGLIFAAVLIILGQVPFLDGGVVWAVGLLAVGFLLYSGDLPRLIRTPAQPKEGVQQMTTTPTNTASQTIQDDAVGGGDEFNAPPPPPPTPTPPILPQPAPPRESSILGRLTLGMMVIALGVLALLDTATDTINPAPRHYIALAVTVLGIGLLVGSVAGRARWLILVGALSMPLLLASPALEFDFDDVTNGTIFVVPDSPEAVPSLVSYGIGEVVIDLTEMDWSGAQVELDAELDIGHMTIYIPETVGVSGLAQTSIGVVQFEGEESNGINPAIGLDTSGSDGQLDLSANVQIGSLEIHRLDNDE